jgi:hypothetical protein
MPTLGMLFYKNRPEIEAYPWNVFTRTGLRLIITLVMLFYKNRPEIDTYPWNVELFCQLSVRLLGLPGVDFMKQFRP